MPDLPRLDRTIPELGFARPDDALDAFLAWVEAQGLTLYSHQEEAILELYSGRHVVLDTPTGSGKSLVATALHFRTFAGLGRAWYTAPIKALVSEKFFELCRVFGAEHVGMMTGDGAVNADAPLICCTAEILADLALREGTDAKVTSVVMDEFHYYADRDRGMAWQLPLLTLEHTQFLLMSGTLGDTAAIREDLATRTARTVTEIRHAHRPVPLEFEYSLRPIHEALEHQVRANRAPIYVVHFTQNNAAEAAQALMSVDWCSQEQKRALADAVRGVSFHSPFGPTLRRHVLHGIGLHHAGLLPRYRLLVERLAQQGLLQVICGTDTLGVGINVPIRTVLFTQLCKFDGEKVITLPVRDFQQIAGRAGRAGFDTRGYVVAQAPAHVIENARNDAAAAKRKKKQKAQPPTFGYKHWDENTFQGLVQKAPEALESRFRIEHGHLLSAMQHAEATGGTADEGKARLLDLVERSHATPARREVLRKDLARAVEALEQVGVLQPGAEGWKVDPTLQHDFSLNHSLSLFLLDALERLDITSSSYDLDVITWVEAILENPRVVLQRQVNRAKGALVAELKASGVPYDERMDALEDVTYPQPLGETIYGFYNAYAAKHPWVTADAVRPKSIAREMAETWMSFGGYIIELDLQRAEGVLLRYLSDVWRALVKNVPADRRTDPLMDRIAWLRATIVAVDSSLIAEWERLLTGADRLDVPVPVDISADPRAFRARVRAELHSLVRALSIGDYEEALRWVVHDPDDPWTPERLANAVAPFLDEHGAIAFDHHARLAEHTQLTATGPHRWELRQRLLPKRRLQVDEHAFATVDELDPDEGTAALEGRIDLSGDTNPQGPILTLISVT